MVSNVSSAVVVPMMINMQETGRGVAKNIPSLVITASCIDSIIAIVGHSVVMCIMFNTGQLWWVILQCPIQILIGICSGLFAAGCLVLLQIDHSVSSI